jgi:hypothetical protein
VLSEESWVREVSSGDNRDEEKAYGKGGRQESGGDCDQTTLYACMKMSQ